MLPGELRDDAASGVIGQSEREGWQIRHVVEDVVANDHIGHWGVTGHLRPGSFDRSGLHTRGPGPIEESLEHPGRGIDPHQKARSRGKRQGRRARAASHVQHNASVGECFLRPLVRRGRMRYGGVRSAGEQLDREGPRRLRGRLEDVPWDSPGRERLAPAHGRRPHSLPPSVSRSDRCGPAVSRRSRYRDGHRAGRPVRFDISTATVFPRTTVSPLFTISNS